ncbi:hypothetical protein CLF_107242 [Clonorchis sinensis]|uniref:Uncharacterized protein n=1 Tax=Clonorchis sinensis TaxID=79923 RepID=G7YGE5_CLOSI|nr:hypothetical protein CLF_107242 [Clonorchis sinensis]
MLWRSNRSNLHFEPDSVAEFLIAASMFPPNEVAPLQTNFVVESESFRFFSGYCHGTVGSGVTNMLYLTAVPTPVSGSRKELTDNEHNSSIAQSLDWAFPGLDGASRQQLLSNQFFQGVQSALNAQLRLARATGELGVEEVVHLAQELAEAPLAKLQSQENGDDVVV